MIKNASSQKVTLLAFDVATGLKKAGDAANITAYVSKDDGTVTVLGDTSATEIDATNARGLYTFDLTQAETNADKLVFSGKSATANIEIVPVLIQTVPASFTSQVAQTGDSYARIGAVGAGLTALGDTRIANLDAAVSTRSTYAGGAVASVTGNVGGNVSGSVASVTAGVTVTTNNDKTGYALSTAGVQAIWDALISALTTVGSIGKRLVDYLTGDIFARLGAPAGASVSADIAAAKADTAAIKAKTDNLPSDPADQSLVLAAIPTAAAVADAVWDEATSGHATAGSTGAALSAAGSSGDPWSTVVPGAYAAGTAGYMFGNIVATGAGAIPWTYTVTSSITGLPIADVDVWATSDAAGLNVLASGRTNASGVVTFYLDAGVTYFWSQKTGINFTNPDAETIA